MNVIQKVIMEPLNLFWSKFLEFLPNVLSSLILLILGIVCGVALKVLFSKILKAIGIDKFFERFGAPEFMKKGGVRDPLSMLLAKLLQWIVIIIFAGLAMQTLRIPAVEKLLETFLLYLPNILVAVLMLLLGYLLGNFLGRAALIAGVNAGIRISGTIGKLVQLSVFILAATIALEQLGIGRDTVVIAFAIIFGGVILSLAIAFGLGGRDAAKEYLEKKLRDEEKSEELDHL